MNRLTTGREGQILYNPNDKYIGRAVELYGEYSELEAQLLRQIVRPGAFVIEVGANMGLHTLVLAKAAEHGHVIAYEPQRAMFQILCANMALNGIMNVSAKEQAVGRDIGRVLIPVPDYEQPGNFGGVSLATGARSGRYVDLVMLDHSFLDIRTSRLDLIKIDVEEMEVDVIFGASEIIMAYKPFLYVENDRLHRSQLLIETIWSLGYQCYWHLPPLYNPHNFRGNPHNVYEGIVSVNMLCVHKSKKVNIEGPGLTLVEHADEHPLATEKRP